LYNLLRASGINLRIAKQSIGGRAATTAEAKALSEAKGAPLLTMERAAYDDQGRAVEHGDHIYRASRYSFDLTLTAWYPLIPRPHLWPRSGSARPGADPRSGPARCPRARC